MPIDFAALELLRARKQEFFLPYYRQIVEKHPGGIPAAEVKASVAALILNQFGIDIFDSSLTEMNPSTRRSSADQWANNLVSNQVLDEYMLVVREAHRAILFPGASDNSRIVPSSGEPLTKAQVSQLDERRLSTIDSSSGPVFRRSLQLAEYVRGLSGRSCAVGGSGCVAFDGRDGRPYVEAHHVIPMAMQSQTTINLDRSLNMVPICPGCHACLHRGAAHLASALLDKVFRWFESVHRVSFQDANGDVGFDVTSAGLLAMYGSGAATD